jgi:Ca2+-transporting ATPase
LGIVAIQDPPKEEIYSVITEAQNAGIRILMVTGDSIETARSIASSVGISVQAVVQGSQIREMPEQKIADLLSSGGVVARATPLDKLKIIEAFQQAGIVTAMTGDGVNDAPALKRADIGIAMGIRGSEVAKAAADMILLDDNLSSLVHAILEGRRQYENIRKFVLYLLSSNFGELIAVALGLILGGPLVLLPIHILWINVVTDSAIAATLGMEKAEPSLLDRQPRRKGSRIFDSEGARLVVPIGLYVGLATVALAHWCRYTGGAERAQTAALYAVTVMEMINVFNFRSLRNSFTKTSLWSNRFLLLGFFGTAVIQVMTVVWEPLRSFLHLVPLHTTDWLAIAACGFPVLLVGDGFKALGRRKQAQMP